MKASWTAKYFIISAAILFCFTCFAQQDTQQLASAAVDTFLQGVKLAELPEGKSMLAQTEWMPGGVAYRLVEYTDAKTIYEGMFDTDISGVRGYKRLIQMNAVSEAHTPLQTRYIVIAYADKQSGTWKVFSTGTDSEVNVDERLAYYKDHQSDPGNLQDSNYLLWYGHWLLMAGKIREAQTFLLKAKEANATNPTSLASRIPGLSSSEAAHPGMAEQDRRLSAQLAAGDSAHIEGLLSLIEHVSGGHI